MGFFVGLVSLRLKGHFFSIFTMCVGYIMYLLIEKWEGLTHGTVGIMGIPAPRRIGRIDFDAPRVAVLPGVVLPGAGVWVMHRIVNSLLGRTFIAIRNGEDLAEALGINLMRNKVLAFMLSVFYAGMAGGLYAGFVRFLGPGIASVEHTFDMTMYMLVGGIGTLLGPLLGAIVGALADAVPAVPAGLPLRRVRPAADPAGDLPAARRRRHLSGWRARSAAQRRAAAAQARAAGVAAAASRSELSHA